jgi:hypothetical protein
MNVFFKRPDANYKVQNFTKVQYFVNWFWKKGKEERKWNWKIKDENKKKWERERKNDNSSN